MQYIEQQIGKFVRIETAETNNKNKVNGIFRITFEALTRILTASIAKNNQFALE